MAVALPLLPFSWSVGRGLCAPLFRTRLVRGHIFTGGSAVTHAQLKCWAASELLLQCLSPCSSTSYSLAPKRRGLWGALSRETEGAGNCAAQADGVTRRELERESTHWLGHVPLPQPPAQGQGLDPCLLNQEAWQEVETGLEEG